MTVAACPTCREPVTLPGAASATAVVRCPWCQAERLLAEFQAQLPPALVVVADGLSDVQAAAAEVGFGGAARDVDAPAFDFTVGTAAPPMVAWRGGPRRAPRRPPNLAWEIAKVLAGALLAVPAAQIILWWCVPDTWRRDLLGIGPSVSRVAPWAVPAQFHPLLVDEEPLTESGGTNRLVTRRARPAAVAPTAPTDAILPRVVPPTAQTPEPPSEPLPISAQSYTSADVQAALEQVVQASVAWDVSPDRSVERQQELADACYAALAHLGAVLAFLQPNAPDTRAQAATIHDLLASFGQPPQKLAALGNRAAPWLDLRARANEGLFLVGTVKNIQPEGQLFVTDLELAAQQRRTVRVYSRLDPQGLYAPGDQLLMLGAFVAHPQDALPGFTGSDGPVALGSFPVRMPR